MGQCVIYARVSTKKQAWGHGLVRQLECCQAFAKDRGVFVRAVYVDVCSGRGDLPNRGRAVEEAKATGYPVYVEAIDRWTRDGDDETLNDDELGIVVCSELFRELAARIEGALRDRPL
jgi:DNA invertase Pin-like site-specific DNA recombinase